MTPQHHIWSYPNASGEKRCLYDGCAVRVRRAYAEWRAGARAPWVSIIRADIPACAGRPPKAGR